MDFKLNDFESFLYESRPFAYLALGAYAFSVEKPNIIVIACALVLLYAGVVVLHMRYSARKDATLNSLVYESLPFLYVGLGVYSLLFLGASQIGVGSGVVLLLCATKVFHWRIRNRKAIARQLAANRAAAGVVTNKSSGSTTSEQSSQ